MAAKSRQDFQPSAFAYVQLSRKNCRFERNQREIKREKKTNLVQS